MSKIQTFDDWFDEFFAPALRLRPKSYTAIRTVAYGAWLELRAQVEADFATRAELTGLLRDARQETVASWCLVCFGEAEASSVPQRGLRHLEEASEAAQAAGVDREQAHKLLDYVFDRPVGDLKQELGGSQLTILALAEAAGISADEAERDEIQRVLAKPRTHFTARNAAKNEAGFRVAGVRA